MAVTYIAGRECYHGRIGDFYRRSEGDEESMEAIIEEASRRVRDLIESHPHGHGHVIHVAVTLEEGDD